MFRVCLVCTKFCVIINVMENALHFCKLVGFPILSKPWPPFESLMEELALFEKILESTLHMYDHHFQTSYSLKALGQSKPIFMWSLLEKGKQIYKNGLGHTEEQISCVSISPKSLKQKPNYFQKSVYHLCRLLSHNAIMFRVKAYQ